MKSSVKEFALICGVLPALFWGLTWFAGGFHYETNDDLLMSFIARGIAFGKPVGDYSIYFHGFGEVFVWLYAQFPAVPWYGVILYALLFLATQLAFWFIYSHLRMKVDLPVIILVLLLFYLANWCEHVFWFNYMRVPFLLAGLVLLLAFCRKEESGSPSFWVNICWGILFFLALCIRPGAALLGILIVLPVMVFRFFGAVNKTRFLVRRSLPFVMAGLVFLILLQVKSSESADLYRQLDTVKSGVLDYQWCCGESENLSGKLIMAGFDHWFIADAKNWQPYLSSGNKYPDWPYIFKVASPQKLLLAIKALIFDQFLISGLIFGLLVVLYFARKEGNWKPVFQTQIYFWLLMLVIAVSLKLPPRVLTPALSLLFLVNLSFLPESKVQLKKLPPWFIGLLFILVGVQFYKIANRINWQQNQQAKAENYIQNIRENYRGKTVITADFGGELRSLSPFRNYDFGSNQILLLTGWHTLDPHFAPYLKTLTGTFEVDKAIEILSQRPETVWILMPEFKHFLTRYMAHFYDGAGGLNSLQEQKNLPNSSFKVYTLPQ